MLRTVIGGGVARPGAVGGRRARRRRRRGCEHRADAAVDAASGRLRRAAWRRGRCGLQLLGVGAGELGELLGVGLEQVRGGRRAGGEQREQRGVGGVDGDPHAPVPRSARDQVAYQSAGAPGGSEPDSDHPRGAGGLAASTPSRPRRRRLVERSAGLVDLGRRAVGLGEREVDAHAARRPATAAVGHARRPRSASTSGSSWRPGSTATASSPAGRRRRGRR